MAGLYNLYDYYWYQMADKRILQYPLVASPVPVIVIMSAYWYMIKKGPEWMKDRPAYNIKAFIQVYNIVQVVVCTLLGGVATYHLLQKDLVCISHDTNSDYDQLFVKLGWMYYIVKISDLLDTVFFVMRKKFALVSTLHTYHHSLMVISCYLVLRFYPAGELSVMGSLNCLVHSVMYFYYFYCLHTGNRQNIWWKKYITQLQLGQFCFLFVVYTWKLFFVTGCSYPKALLVFALIQVVTMLNMFGNYYYNAFLKPKPKAEANNNLSPLKKKVQ